MPTTKSTFKRPLARKLHTMSRTDIEGVTGRDSYIEAKALIYAIAMIQSLPEDRQEWSDMRDMCAIARTIPSHGLATLIYETQGHTGTVIDIWPDHDEDLTEHECREKKAFKFAVGSHVEAFERSFAASVAGVTKEVP